MNNVYFGLNNVAEKPSKIYIGDSNGVARKVKKAYLGVNGVAKKVYSSEPIDDEWDYTLSGNDIILNYWKYNNTTADDIVVYSTYTINGQTYNTKIADIPPSWKDAHGVSQLPPYMFHRFSTYSSSQWLNSVTFEQGVDTSDCTDISFMFANSNLNVYGLEYLDVSNVQTMCGVFRELGYNKYIDGIKNWDVRKVKYFATTFTDVRNTVIDISGWNTSGATQMDSMFRNNYTVPTTEHIYVGNGWNTSGVTSSYYMFTGQTLLPNFNSNYIDKTRAYVGSGGYLERKS